MKPTYEGLVAMHINNAGVLALRVASESDIKNGNAYSSTYSFFHVPKYYGNDYVEDECKNRLVSAKWQKPSLRRFMPSVKAKSRAVTKTLKRLSK